MDPLCIIHVCFTIYPQSTPNWKPLLCSLNTKLHLFEHIKQVYKIAGEMAQLLRAHTALVEALNSVPNTHVLTAACDSICRALNILFWPPKEPALKNAYTLRVFEVIGGPRDTQNNTMQKTSLERFIGK